MGRITAPFGVKGWVKIQPFTAAPENLLEYPRWWIGKDDDWRECAVERAQVQTAIVVAKLAGSEDRDAAALYRGQEIAIPREAFPEAAANEFYWADLIGLAVLNTEGADLGKVSEVFETGSNDVLVVQGERERLIPFTSQVVKQVDLAAGFIRVDWASEY